jgi:hypothetical protein
MPMSDQGPGNEQPLPAAALPPVPAEPPPPAPEPLHPLLAGLLLLLGLIALLPGICAVTFMVGMSLPGGFFDPGMVVLWLVCLAISAGGILLIRAVRRRRPVSRNLT